MIIGRDTELATARTALKGGPGLVVTGEAGVGKSALVAAALDARPTRVGQCFRSLAWTPALPLQQALGRPIPAGDPAWTAHWIARQLGPAVLVLDDLQWADALTLAVVRHLPPNAVVALTVRTGDPGTAAALEHAGAASGSERVRLEIGPLPQDAAVTLARDRHPRLHRAEAELLAQRCGGNPLLIEELGTDPAPNAGLRRTLVGRVRRLGPGPWADFALLALADEPLPTSWLADAAALVDAGLAVRDDDAVRPRHPLLAEAMTTELRSRPADRRHAEHTLGELAENHGHAALAARAFAAAGDRDRATRLAVDAAHASDRPGQRAALLHLAATCAPPGQADELAARAVEELVVAGYYAQAADLLEQLPERTDARWCGLVGRVRWEQGDDDRAGAAYRTGLADPHAAEPDRVLLEIENARWVTLASGDYAGGLMLARAAHAHAEAAGVEQARALAVLGTCESMAGEAGGAEHLAQAAERAAQSGDLLVEFTSANNLIATYESAGDAARARELAATYASRADELHLRTWAQQMRAMQCNAAMHLGDYDTVVSSIPVLLASAPDARTRDQLEVTLALAHTDLGRQQTALDRIDARLATDAAEDFFGVGSLLYARAEALLWSGEFEAAARDAATAIEHTPAGGQRLFALVTKAHADWRLGVAPEPEAPEPHLPVLAAAPFEVAGFAALARGDRTTAHERFTRAVELWTGRHERGARRCRWLAAACHPDDALAQADLLALEAELLESGWLPLLGQVRRTLRERGVRSAAPRARRGGLTAREREVLDLVAQGLSNDQIAASLGLSPTTIAAQVASARARLGAVNRWQAANDS